MVYVGKGESDEESVSNAQQEKKKKVIVKIIYICIKQKINIGILNTITHFSTYAKLFT